MTPSRRIITLAESADARLLSDEEVERIDQLTLVETINGELTIDHYVDWREQFTWRNVFDCKLPVNLAGAAQKAKDAGYRFVAFAGEVYFVSYKGTVEHAGLSVEDLR